MVANVNISKFNIMKIIGKQLVVSAYAMSSPLCRTVTSDRSNSYLRVKTRGTREGLHELLEPIILNYI